MAQITGSNTSSVFQIKRWLGLNESPDGDTILEMGESPVMRNFRITKEGHLQVRPGYAPVCTLSDGHHVRCMWSGWIMGKHHLLAACGYQVWDVDLQAGTAVSIGEIGDGVTHFFGFAQKVYILDGQEYYCWDGTGELTVVEGYIPIVETATPPEGGGTLLERVNVLTGKRRAQFSPDGTATVFHLPEKELDEVISVDGTEIAWSVDVTAGTVTFESAPAEGINTVTVTWRKGYGDRQDVAACVCSEIYNGATDARVFLYGNGTNKCYYSDLDENGVPTAEYIPEMNTIAVDSANTPIQSMVRHYDRLMVFKRDGAFCVQQSTLTLETGDVVAAFHCVPVNRNVGSEMVGGAVLVKNNPRTLYGHGVYEWSLSGAGSRDERNAKRISDRISATMAEFPLHKCVVFDDEAEQEYYIVCESCALVNNYANDTWYYYDNFPADCMISVDNRVYFGTPDGRIMALGREWRGDDGESISAYWESGSMDFGAGWRRKYSTDIWVTLKPETQSRVSVSVETDKKADYAQKIVAHSMSTFMHMDFSHFSFNTNRRPRVVRVRMKVKKFVFYKLIFASNSNSATATILGADMQVRYTGNVK